MMELTLVFCGAIKALQTPSVGWRNEIGLIGVIRALGCAGSDSTL